MADHNALAEGLAVYLDDQGIGRWSPNAEYTANDTGIVIDAHPQDPPNLITLTVYPVDDDLESDSLTGVQVITRSAGPDPRPSRDLTRRVFQALHGLERITLNGVPISLCWRQSGASLGQDQARRWSHTANYYIRTEL